MEGRGFEPETSCPFLFPKNPFFYSFEKFNFWVVGRPSTTWAPPPPPLQFASTSSLSLSPHLCAPRPSLYPPSSTAPLHRATLGPPPEPTACLSLLPLPTPSHPPPPSRPLSSTKPLPPRSHSPLPPPLCSPHSPRSTPPPSPGAPLPLPHLRPFNHRPHPHFPPLRTSPPRAPPAPPPLPPPRPTSSSLAPATTNPPRPPSSATTYLRYPPPQNPVAPLEPWPRSHGDQGRRWGGFKCFNFFFF
jgi:hypothetical protein